MNDATDPTDGNGASGGNDAGVSADDALEQMPVEAPRRAASLTLRTQDARAESIASMEAASRSLADALRITHRLVLGVMGVLVVMFLLSGFQQVNESERGILVRFGEIRNEDLEPGFHLSWPYPVGEIVKVDRGQSTLDINYEFWEYLKPGDRLRQLSDVTPGKSSLMPGFDGSMITADQGLVHTRWQVIYTKQSPRDFLRNMPEEENSQLLSFIVQRAAVFVVAEIPTQEMLKKQFSETGEGEVSVAGGDIERRVRILAQQQLDELSAGITLTSVTLREVQPPGRTQRAFQSVQSDEDQAAEKITKARQTRDELLTRTAGRAHEVLLALIEQYGTQQELGQLDQAADTLAHIEGVMQGDLDGTTLTVNGVTYTDIRIGGDVSGRISQAESIRRAVVSKAETDAGVFEAKLDRFNVDRVGFLVSEWADAMIAFLNQDHVEVFIVPSRSQAIKLVMTSDKRLAEEIGRARRRREAQQNAGRQLGFDANTLTPMSGNQ